MCKENKKKGRRKIRKYFYKINSCYTLLGLTTCMILFNVNVLLATVANNQWQTFVEMSTSTAKSLSAIEQTNSLHDNSLDAFDALKRTFKGVEKLVLHLLHEDLSYENSLMEILTELTTNAEQSLEMIGGQLLEIGNNLLTDVFQRLQQQVARIKYEFENMTNEMDNTFDWAVNYLNVTLMDHSEKIDNFAADLKHKLRSINDTVLYKHGCKEVDTFVDTSTKLLRKCCSVTIKPMKSFCWKSRYILTDTLSLLVDMLERIQFCLEDQDSYNDFLMPCLNLAYNDVSNLIERAVALRKRIEASIPLRLMISRHCFSAALVHIEESHGALTRNLTSFK